MTKDNETFYVQSLLSHMKKVPDYRCSRKKLHDHAEMLTCLIAGYISGRTSVDRALHWCKDHIELLRMHMNLSGGIPSEATISRMLSGIDEEMFSFVFMEWISEILNERGIHIIIDGKALRGATEKIKGGKTPYVLNAIDAATELVIAQLPINEKTNEITAIPMLLASLDVKDNTFTIDAIGTQKKIEKQIVENGGHFVLQVKKNNPALYEEIITAFTVFEKELKAPPAGRAKHLRCYLDHYDTYSKQEKNRERIEHRKACVCTETNFLSCVKEGENNYIKTAGCITQIRVPIEKDKEGRDITVSKDEYIKSGSNRKPVPMSGDGIGDDIQKFGMISDMELSAKDMASYKRHHWKIENNLHHVLDDAFREDRSTATRSKNNLSLIRKISYNVLRLSIIREHPDFGIQRMMDYFCDHPKQTTKYLFEKIESFY